MGQDKTTTQSSQQGTQTLTPTATAQEQRILDAQESIFMKSVPGQERIAGFMPQTIEGLLRGGAGLPDVFSRLFAGISPEAMGAEATRLTQEGLVGGQASGLQDSGVLQRSIASDIANRLLFPAEESRRGMNYNLLSLGLGSSLPYGNTATGSLNQSLAGLRSVTGTSSGSSTSTVSAMNPFLKSFQTGMGRGLAGGLTGGLGGMFAGGLGGFGGGFQGALMKD